MVLTEEELNLGNAADLAQRGCAAISAGTEEFDLSSINSVDSSAVAVLLAWQRQAHQQQRSIRLVAAPASLLSLINLYGLQDFFEMREPRVAA
ncbi:STAS domain-containing protein [Undibacterium cyanobacteriorum]|uniref:STAS domain-containing protein n=1 Tax=Undibacterium cyanobacteriorum TaxID=3073561 RepID=A0ABY9RHX5_9BURK|nr:STAS domain-containing protein [Undibacterium sp. 20NA77.5]WMW80274.1 STAS domain-containing protein [Undibacterium sp. 20NA77.5]